MPILLILGDGDGGTTGDTGTQVEWLSATVTDVIGLADMGDGGILIFSKVQAVGC